MHSSGLSPVLEYIWEVHKTSLDFENAKRPHAAVGNLNVLNNIIKNYYSDINKSFIIDRERSWIHVENIELIKSYITKEPKILFTVRPIIEVLSSYILIHQGTNVIEENMKKVNWCYKENLSLNDNKCDFLMRPWGGIDAAITAFSHFKKNNEMSMIHIVEYNDLVSKPEKTLNEIYDFLKIDKYSHDFNNIIKKEIDNDEIFGLPKDLHKVKNKIAMSEVNPYDILSEYAINKYSNMNFWRN